MDTKWWGVAVMLLVALTVAGCATARGAYESAQRTGTEVAYAGVVREYPGTPEARLAQQQFDRLGEAREWDRTRTTDQAAGYRGFLAGYPNSTHAGEARTRLAQLEEAAAWQEAARVNSETGYQRYLATYSTGAHREEARRLVETLVAEREWTALGSSLDPAAWEQYAARYPGSTLAAGARDQAAALNRDRSAFAAAERQNTADAYRRFGTANPGSPYLAEARKRADELERDAAGRTLAAATAAGKVEAEVTGSGIDEVSLRVRNRSGHPLRVTIPAGTYFVCQGSAQNMVGRSEQTLQLDDDQWRSTSVSTACANMHRDVPQSGSRFTVTEAPNSEELKRAMAQVPTGLGYATVQALVWIITDNADYDDLGTLVSRSQFQLYGGTRLIGENETVRALQLIDAAGIALTNKNIWRDRELLLNGLTDDGLKRWWRQKLGR